MIATRRDEPSFLKIKAARCETIDSSNFYLSYYPVWKKKKINKNKNTAERGREWSRVRPIIGLFVDHITTRLHCFSLIADWWDKVNKVKSKDQRGSLGSSWSRLVFYGIVLASGCGNGNFRLQPIHLILFGIASVEKINGRSFFTICQWNNRNAWGL